MSDFGDQAAAIVTEIGTTLTAYKEAQDGYERIESVDSGRHPFAMVFNPVATASEIAEGFLQSVETVEWSIILLRDAGQGDEMRADVEALKDALNDSANLGGIVHKVFVSAWGSDEVRDDKTVGAIVVTLERDVA